MCRFESNGNITACLGDRRTNWTRRTHPTRNRLLYEYYDCDVCFVLGWCTYRFENNNGIVACLAYVALARNYEVCFVLRESAESIDIIIVAWLGGRKCRIVKRCMQRLAALHVCVKLQALRRKSRRVIPHQSSVQFFVTLPSMGQGGGAGAMAINKNAFVTAVILEVDHKAGERGGSFRSRFPSRIEFLDDFGGRGGGGVNRCRFPRRIEFLDEFSFFWKVFCFLYFVNDNFFVISERFGTKTFRRCCPEAIFFGYPVRCCCVLTQRLFCGAVWCRPVVVLVKQQNMKMASLLKTFCNFRP